MAEVEVVIKQIGQADIVYEANSAGYQTAKEIADKVIEIVGERPMRKRRRV
tara:strand:+ start:174 stop:326 length:153 start_codon:yes stop_codon:yes gene_type:complete